MTNNDSFQEAGTQTIERTSATPPRLLALILLSAIAVLPVNMILPSLPNIAATFHADFALVNLSVAGFAIITAIIEAIGGAISDRFGRRRVVMMSLLIFIAASIGCVIAPNVAFFLFFRTMQASIAPCYSVALVIIKETSDESQAVSKFGYLAMSWALAPMIGPLLGGSLDELFGWRSSFVVFAMLGAAALALSASELNGIQAPPSSKSRYSTAYVQLLGSARFWAYTLCMACSMGVLYVFLGGAPLVVGNLLGGSSAKLGLYMGLVPTGFIMGSYLAGRFASHRSLAAVLISARLLTCAGLLVGLILAALGVTNVFAFFGPCVFVGMGNGLTMPAANSGAMSVRSDLVGTAAGLAAATRIAGGAVIAAVAGLLLADSVRALFVLMLVPALLALLAALIAACLDRRAARSLM